MQQQPYGNYPYYGQPMYPQTPYMGVNAPPGPSGGYPPFYGPPKSQQVPAPAPQNANPPAPSPYSFDAAAYAIKPGAPPVAASRRHRRNPTMPSSAPSAPAAPLKSAMKKTMNVFTTAETTIGRQFSNPFNNQQQNQPPPFPRPRVQSNPSRPLNAKEPSYDQEKAYVHLFISFHNFNELHIEHISQVGLEEMRRVIWPLWPDGIESDTITGHTCIVKFRNTPWDLNGPSVRHSYKLITSIFGLFEQRGFSFQTAVNIITPTPRLIFQVTEPDSATEFFLAFFSQDGRKLTLVNPPNRVDLSIGAQLRSALPGNTLADNVVEDYMRVIEVKRKLSHAPEIDSSVIFVEVLKILNNLGFQLDAILPLGRRGPLGMRSTREIFVFKSLKSAR